MRDGVNLAGIMYMPRNCTGGLPAIVTLTPYTAQRWHQFGMMFAAHGYVFCAVDVRGRGNSEGRFHPLQEGADGFDVVEWVARQPYCNGSPACS